MHRASYRARNNTLSCECSAASDDKICVTKSSEIQVIETYNCKCLKLAQLASASDLVLGGHGFDPQLGQTKIFNIGSYCFPVRHMAFQNRVAECGDTFEMQLETTNYNNERRMVLSWDYSQGRKCNLKQVASDLAPPVMIIIAMTWVGHRGFQPVSVQFHMFSYVVTSSHCYLYL